MDEEEKDKDKSENSANSREKKGMAYKALVWLGIIKEKPKKTLLEQLIEQAEAISPDIVDALSKGEMSISEYNRSYRAVYRGYIGLLRVQQQEKLERDTLRKDIQELTEEHKRHERKIDPQGLISVVLDALKARAPVLAEQSVKEYMKSDDFHKMSTEIVESHFKHKAGCLSKVFKASLYSALVSVLGAAGYGGYWLYNFTTQNTDAAHIKKLVERVDEIETNVPAIQQNVDRIVPELKDEIKQREQAAYSIFAKKEDELQQRINYGLRWMSEIEQKRMPELKTWVDERAKKAEEKADSTYNSAKKYTDSVMSERTRETKDLSDKFANFIGIQYKKDQEYIKGEFKRVNDRDNEFKKEQFKETNDELSAVKTRTKTLEDERATKAEITKLEERLGKAQEEIAKQNGIIKGYESRLKKLEGK